MKPPQHLDLVVPKSTASLRLGEHRPSDPIAPRDLLQATEPGGTPSPAANSTARRLSTFHQ
ncbi:MAG: hypothetical protein ACKOJF_06340, partial [Planctomycetaceae bacterium]